MVNLEKWEAMPTHIKMLNIGSEINRIINLHEKKSSYAFDSCYRALELIDITAKKGFRGTWELCRVRELICSLVYEDNTVNNSALKRYFNSFACKRN